MAQRLCARFEVDSLRTEVGAKKSGINAKTNTPRPPRVIRGTLANLSG